MFTQQLSGCRSEAPRWQFDLFGVALLKSVGEKFLFGVSVDSFKSSVVSIDFTLSFNVKCFDAVSGNFVHFERFISSA